MTDLLAARMQMALSLGFHIIFACIGMAMPFFMAWSHACYLKTKKPVYYDLTRLWSRGVAIFFATGAVSGTALSFELGLLWPGFMEHAGAIIGMPFSWEGTAFFLEAIALGIFLYGWNRIPPLLHWFCGLMVGITGVASGFFVVAANGWMNSPAGFDLIDGVYTNIDPWAAMFNKAAFHQGIHMIIAAFVASGFAIAGLHALMLLRQPQNVLHRKALKISLGFAAVAACVQPISGDLIAKDVAQRQPLKLAAMESHFETEKGAGLIIGGIPDIENETVRWGIRVPGLLSLLAHGDPDAEVSGLKDFPRENWPPVKLTHISFQIMVFCGTLLTLIGLLGLWRLYRAPEKLFNPAYLRALALATPLGFIAVEAGWMVTELGRQPWIIYEVMRTSEAVTPMPGLVYPLSIFACLYMVINIALIWLMARQFRAAEAMGPWEE